MKLLTVSQVADILGFNRRSITRYFEDGTIPGAFRLEGFWRIDERDLEKWVETRKDPKGFLERELKALRATQEYKDADKDVRIAKETALEQNWFPKAKKPTVAAGFANTEKAGDKQE